MFIDYHQPNETINSLMHSSGIVMSGVVEAWLD